MLSSLRHRPYELEFIFRYCNHSLQPGKKTWQDLDWNPVLELEVVMVNDPEQDPVALGQRGPVGPEKQGQLTRTEKNMERAWNRVPWT